MASSVADDDGPVFERPSDGVRVSGNAIVVEGPFSAETVRVVHRVVEELHELGHDDVVVDLTECEPPPTAEDDAVIGLRERPGVIVIVR